MTLGFEIVIGVAAVVYVFAYVVKTLFMISAMSPSEENKEPPPSMYS